MIIELYRKDNTHIYEKLKEVKDLIYIKLYNYQYHELVHAVIAQLGER